MISISIPPLANDIMAQMAIKLDGLVKPLGSLGRLEQLAIQLSGISNNLNIHYPDKRVLVFAADHGVYDEGVAVTPQDVTVIQASNMARGLTGVCAIAKSVCARVIAIDVGIKSQQRLNGVLAHKIRFGCDNIMHGPAMSRAEAIQALNIGIQIAHEAITDGATILAMGELGMANTTPAAAIISSLCQAAVADVVGLGANLPENRLAHKVKVVEQAISVNQPNTNDGIDVLAKVGGFELGAMAGAMLASAERRIPIVLDGFLSYSAALIAVSLAPMVSDYLIPSHLSAEKGAIIALKKLQLTPYFDFKLRLGEGSGAALMFPFIDAACSIVNNMGNLTDFAISLPDQN